MSRTVLKRGVLGVFGCCLVAGIASVALAASDETLLREKLESIESWSAQFNQTVKDGKGEIIQRVSGELKLRKPLQFSWETQEPFPQLLVSNGEQLWVFDQDLDQVVIRDMGPELAPMPASILSGRLDRLSEHFNVTRYEVGIEEFTLTPKEESQDFESLVLKFDGNLLESLHLKDSLGQTTALRFESALINPDLQASNFEFSVPDGVDVIDERTHDAP